MTLSCLLIPSSSMWIVLTSGWSFFLKYLFISLAMLAQRLKRLPAMQETWVLSLGRKDPLEKEMATHSSILAWRIPWTEKPGGLQSTGSQRVGHDWATSLSLGYVGLSCSMWDLSLQSMDFSLVVAHGLKSTGPVAVAHGIRSPGSVAVVHGLSTLEWSWWATLALMFCNLPLELQCGKLHHFNTHNFLT